ncbi:efflux RND transporter periplasmic adaptor subunit [Photobacterium sanguinicancri]|uniref:efflux RND transporter periplasmic adaptor subunit n=1 Tax=Photobacterium sanguinicancri TaxID=875932 RepID=UPI000786FD18|nr:efflux RND transporter periplasmic adaptor subunit [Photobacterium sanguinicancri]KXI23396.1 hemolysin D [Photobacterium sanguinicancri]
MNTFTKTTLAALLVSLTGCNQSISSIPVTKAERPVQVIELQTAQPTTQKYFSGVVQSQEQAALAFRVPGTITNIWVKKGDVVTKGQALAQLDPHDYQVALEELQARMLEARSAHKLAKAELKRVKQATQDDAIANVNLDRAISGYERSLSAVKVVEKNIQRATDTLSYTTLTAPFNGVIGDITLDSFEQVLPGRAVLTLQQNNRLEVEIDVPESLIAKFELNQIAALSWFQSDKSLLATVSEITTTPNLIKQTYTVTLTLDDYDPELFPGKTVTVSTPLSLSDSDYCLPYSALIGNKEDMHVHLIRNNLIARESVDLQSLDAYSACVTGNFVADDYVVISGSSYLTPGDNAPTLIIKTL